MIRLCIADDEPIIREGLQSLDWASIDVELLGVARNGLEALELVSSEPIDVILADIRMPLLDGVELAERLFAEKFGTKVVLLSGHNDFEYARRAIATQVSDYLLKPASPDAVLSAVARAGEAVLSQRATDMRIALLEAELGKRQLVMNDQGILLGEVSHSRVFGQALGYILEHFTESVSLGSMSSELNFSSIYLSRVIKKSTGYTFLELLNGLRATEAARLLRETDLSFANISERVGMADYRYFGQVLKKTYGVPPSKYRRGPVPALDEKLACMLADFRNSMAA